MRIGKSRRSRDGPKGGRLRKKKAAQHKERARTGIPAAIDRAWPLVRARGAALCLAAGKTAAAREGGVKRCFLLEET